MKGRSLLDDKFKASLGYERHCFKRQSVYVCVHARAPVNGVGEGS